MPRNKYNYFKNKYIKHVYINIKFNQCQSFSSNCDMNPFSYASECMFICVWYEVLFDLEVYNKGKY